MKKILKSVLGIVFSIFSIFSLFGCGTVEDVEDTEITVDYLTFNKINSYNMYFGAGSGRGVGASVFKVETKISSGKLIKYGDFSFTNPNGTPIPLVSLEIFDKGYDFDEEELHSVVLDTNDLDGYQLNKDEVVYLVITYASGTLGGEHNINYLSTTIDKVTIDF